MKKGLVLAACLLAVSLSVMSTAKEDSLMTTSFTDLCFEREITVHIKGIRDRPLDEVNVDLFYKGKKVAYGRTDSDGAFTFSVDKEGEYSFQASKSGYADLQEFLSVKSCPTTTTTTSSTSTTTTSTTTSTTTTLPPICDGDYLCSGEENYYNCPTDCPSGGIDGFCDGISDSRCDSDCARDRDPDCYCNLDGVCESSFEDYNRCPRDCKRNEKDSYCDRLSDGFCDPDCEGEEDPDCKKTDYSVIILPLIVLLVLFGIFSFFVSKKEFKQRKIEDRSERILEELKERLKDGEDPEALRKELAGQGMDTSILDKAEERIWQ